MLPQPTRRELVVQNFVQSLKMHIFRNISPNTVQLAPKTLNCVGWGATTPLWFPDLFALSVPVG
ncbi:MAG: hypothetical protein V7L20_14795 [Nostoc sp.]